MTDPTRYELPDTADLGLIPDYYEEVPLEDYPPPDNLTGGCGGGKVIIGLVDVPGQPAPLQVWAEWIIEDWLGRVVSKIQEGTYYETHRSPPLFRKRVTWALTWLPGVNHRQDLTKVDEDVESWDPDFFVSGRRKSTLSKSGMIVYALAPVEIPNQIESIDYWLVRGVVINYSTLEIAKRIDLQTARHWSAAVNDRGIVEVQNYPQRAMWVKNYTVEKDHLTEEWDKWVKVRVTYDYLTNTARAGDPEVIPKENVRYSLGRAIQAPRLTARLAGEAGVRLEARGGGAPYPVGWPNQREMTIAPTAYRFYRRTVSVASTSPLGDPLAIWVSDPAAASSSPLVAHSTVTDLATGDPTSAVPSAESYAEPETPAPPSNVERWELVAEVTNVARRDSEGLAATVDAEVEDGSEYEYAATAEIDQEESPFSNRVPVAYDGGRTRSSGVTVTVRTTDDGIEAEATPPAEYLADSTDPEYGETITMDVPAVVDTEAGAAELMQEIAPRVFSREAPRDELRLRPSLPLPMLERGQLIRPESLAGLVLGGGLQLETATDDDVWRVEGWDFSVSRGTPDGPLQVIPGEIIAERIRR